MKITKQFKQLTKKDTKIAGGKGASLGEMINAGIPVPDGFVLLSEAFEIFLEQADLNVEIESILGSVDINKIHTVEEASEKISTLITRKQIPGSISNVILNEFKKLDQPFVAVRSSATAEDSATAAWAGQLETYLNTTEKTLLKNVRKCWASLYTPRAIFYRFEQKLDKEKISVAVVIQKMVDSERSGIAFTTHPITQNDNQILIEAGFGLGEAIVSGTITPDSYVISKNPLKIIDINVNNQSKALYKKEGGDSEWKQLGEKGVTQVLNKKEILRLTTLLTKIEQHYGFPVDIEWAYERNSFYITQARPITSLTSVQPLKVEPAWEKIISRNIPPFGWSAGAHYEFNGLHIGPVFWKRNREIIVKNNTEQHHVFFDANEFYITNIKEIFKEKFEEFNLALDKEIEFIDSVILAGPAKTKKELKKLNADHKKSFGVMLMCLDLVNELKESLENEIDVSPENLEEIFTPMKATVIERENRAIQQAIHKYEKDTSSLEKVTKLLTSEFGYIHQDYMGKSWTASDYAKTIKNPNNKLAQSDKNKLLNKKYPSNVMDIINTIKKVIFLYEEGRNAMVRLVWAILQSKKTHKLNNDLLLHMTEDEFEGFLKSDKKLNEEKILNRKKYFALFFNDGSFNIFSSKKEVENLLESENLPLNCEEVDGVKLLKGTVANKGKAKGRVRLVFNQKDALSIEPGEILVSPMTAVEFLTGIRNASAIITDEGGIICHAAIVARELNKPCIIGTSNATQILKNGDYVEVDANRGIIKIQKK
jgi:phosphoenolpyruvate synthase/pyruvate phosphate dikinase